MSEVAAAPALLAEPVTSVESMPVGEIGPVAEVAPVGEIGPVAEEPRARSSPRRFRHVDARLALTPDQRRRQAVIVRLALDELGSPDAIRAFLNDHHDGLGGRPLDLAVASDAGLAAAVALVKPAGPRG